MTGQDFCLKPFPSAVPLPDLEITGSISRQSNTLAIRYALLGSLEKLLIPAPVETPLRRNNLWKDTCFEFFLGIKNSDAPAKADKPSSAGRYWEFNLSPAGHWNVYQFNAYRQEIREDPAFSSLPFRVQIQPDSLRLALEFDLNRIVQADIMLMAGISAVIKSMDHRETYWALTHPGAEPDFHRRDSFIIEL